MWLMKKTPHVDKITPRRNWHPNYENHIKEHPYLLWSHIVKRQIINTHAVVLPVVSLLRVFHIQPCQSHQTACIWWPTGLLPVKLGSCSFMRNTGSNALVLMRAWHFRQAMCILSLNLKVILTVDNTSCYLSFCTHLEGKFSNTFSKPLTRSSFFFHL